MRHVSIRKAYMERVRGHEFLVKAKRAAHKDLARYKRKVRAGKMSENKGLERALNCRLLCLIGEIKDNRYRVRVGSLAYGIARGMAYAQVEPRTHGRGKGDKPEGNLVADILKVCGFHLVPFKKGYRGMGFMDVRDWINARDKSMAEITESSDWQSGVRRV